MGENMIWAQKAVCRLLCGQGNEVTSLCSSINCNGLPIACSNNQCSQCSSIHLNCETMQIYQEINLKLKEKKRNNEMIQKIILMINNVNKDLQMLNSQFNRLGQKSQPMFISQNMSTLSKALQTGDKSLITKQLLVQYYKQTKNSSYQNDMQNKINQHIKLIQNKLDQIHRTNDEIRNIYGLCTNLYTFSDQQFLQKCHHPSIEILKEKIIRMKCNSQINVKSSKDYNKICLLTPSIQSQSMRNMKHHFKLLRGNYSLFGVYHIKYATKTQFQHINVKGESGFYGISAFHGHSFSHSFPNQHDKVSPIGKTNINDIIQIFYDKKSQKLKIKNLTSYKQTILSLKTVQKDQLYIGIALNMQNQTVQYLGKINKQQQ